jgi:hypothetical protein
MSDQDTCRYPGCDEESRERGEEEYPDSDKDFKVSLVGSRFCSVEHELKHENHKADAKEAKRSEEEQRGVEKKDLPEYDGPPY